MAQGRIKLGIDIVKGDVSGLVALRHDLESLKGITEKDLIKLNVSDAQGELRKISQEVAAVEAALEKSFNKKLNTNSISTFNKELQKSGYTLQGLVGHWNTLDAKSKQASISLTSMLMTQNKHLKESSQLLDKMSETMSNTIRWTVASSALNAMTGAVQKAYSFTKQLDRSLNDIMIVTGKSSDEMARFAQQANKAAKNLGAVTTDYTKAALIYYQQGLSEAEVQARSETTVKVANITGQSADAVSQQLTAVWNGYKVSAKESEAYIDKLAKVAARTAADLEELSTGMSRVASAASIMGVDIDQLNAQLATIVSVTREAPESIGTALKTVYARMSDIESGLDAETTLGEYTKQMKAFGINAIDAQGNLRDMGTVIEEIGNKWDTLNRSQQAALAQTVAGTRQYSRMMALFDNWDMYQAAKSDSKNAAGTVQEQNEIYLESLEAHFNTLQAEAENLYQTLFNADDLKPLVDALTKLVGLTDNLIGGLGGGDGLLGVLSSVGLTMFGDKLAGGMARVARNTQSFLTSLNDAKVMQQQMDALSAKTGITEHKALEDLVELKREQLKIEKFLTQEQQDQAAALLNNVAKEQKDKIRIEDDLKRAKAMRDSIVGDRGDNTDAGKLKILDEDYTRLRSVTKEVGEVRQALEATDKAYAKAQNSLKIQLQRREKAASHIKNMSDADLEARRKEEVAKIAANIKGDDEASQEAFDQAYQVDNMSLDDFRAYLEANDSVLSGIDSYIARYKGQIAELQETQVTSIEEAIDGGTLKFEELAEQVDILKNKDIVNEEELEQLDGMKKKFTDIAKLLEDNGDKLNFNLNTEQGKKELDELVASLKEFARMNGEATPKLKALIDTLENGEQELSETKRRLEEAKKAAEEFAESFSMERVMGSITDVTSGVVSLFSAIEQLHNLGDIWSNEDLSTGEKLFRTIVALASATGLAVNSFKQLKDGWSAASDMFGKYIAKKVKAEAASGTANMASAATEKIKAAATRDSADATRESTEAQREENNEERNTQANNVKSAVTEELDDGKSSKFSKLKTKTAGKWSKYFGKAGGGSLKAAAGGAAAVAGAIAIVVASTYGMFKLVEHFEKKEEKALEQAKKSVAALSDQVSIAQQKMDELNTSIANITSLKDELDGLVEGTVEWQEALSNLNAEVLQLIEKYPELSQYLEMENGVMSLSDYGLDRARQKQLDELQASQAALNSAKLNEQNAEIDLLTNDAVEKATGAATNQAGAAAATTGTAAAAGALIGLIGGPMGMLIGAAIGAAVGGIGAAVNYAVQEDQEDRMQKEIENGALDDFVALYKEQGEVAFRSEYTLVQELGRELTATEKALMANREATLELVAEMAVYESQLRANLLQIGTSLTGEKATAGEKLIAGEMYQKAYKEASDEVTKYANKNVKAASEEALELMGLNKSSLISTKDKNNITYLDASGAEQSMNIQQVIATLAKNKATENTKESVTKMQTAFQSALASFADNDKLRSLVSEIGLQGSNFNSATLAEFEKLQNLTVSELSAIADAQGKTLNEVRTAYQETIAETQAAWDRPAGLEGEVLTSFKAMVSNVNRDEVALETYTKFANTFDKVAETFGSEGMDVMVEAMAQAGKNSDDLMEAISSIDWTAEDAYVNFSQAISNANIDLDLDVFSELYAVIRNINDVYTDSTEFLKRLNNQVLNLIDSLTYGDIISPENYETITKNWSKEAKKQFVELRNGSYMFMSAGTDINQAWSSYMDEGFKNTVNSNKTAVEKYQGLLNDYDRVVGSYNEANAAEDEFDEYIKNNTVRASKTQVQNAQAGNKKVTTPYYTLQYYNGSTSSRLINDEYSGIIGDTTYDAIAYAKAFNGDIGDKNLSDSEITKYVTEALIKSGDYKKLSKEAQKKIATAYTDGYMNSKGELVRPNRNGGILLPASDTYEFQNWKNQPPSTTPIVKAPLQDNPFDNVVEKYYATQEEYNKNKGELDRFRDANGDILTVDEINKMKAEAEENIKAGIQNIVTNAISFEDLKLAEEYAETIGLTADTIENYDQNLERVALETLQSIEELTDLPAAALKNYVENYVEAKVQATEANEEVTLTAEIYQEAFGELLKGTKDWDNAIENANKSLADLDNSLSNLAGAKAISNLREQLKEIETIIQKINGVSNDAGEVVDPGAKTRLYNSTSATLGASMETLDTLFSYYGLAFGSSDGTTKLDKDSIMKQLFDSEGKINEDFWNGLSDAYYANYTTYSKDAEMTKLWGDIEGMVENYRTKYEGYEEAEEEANQKKLDINLDILNREADQKTEKREFNALISDLLADSDDNIAARVSKIYSGNSVSASSKIKDDQGQEKDFTFTTAQDSAYEHSIQKINDTKDALTALETKWNAKEISEAAYYEQSAQLYAEQIEELKTLKEYRKELAELELEALEQVASRSEELTDARNNMIDVMKKEHQLQKLINGEDTILDYSDVITQQDAKVQGAKDELEYWTTLKNADTFASESEEYQKQVMEGYRAAATAVIDETTTLIEERQNEFLEKQKQALQTFEAELTNQVSLQDITDQWDWAQSMDEQYLDTIEEVFAGKELQRAFDKAVENTTNTKAIKAINQLRQTELDYLAKKDKLTQKDYDRAEAKLKLLEAELALEDARDSKTQMRLMRSANGSYSYQYVANATDVAEKEEAVSTAQSDLYNMDKEAYQTNIEDFNTTYTAYKDYIAQAYEDGTLNAEEEEMLANYEEELAWLAEDNEYLRSNFIETAEMFGGTVDTLLTTTTNGFQTMIENFAAAYAKAKETTDTQVAETEEEVAEQQTTVSSALTVLRNELAATSKAFTDAVASDKKAVDECTLTTQKNGEAVTETVSIIDLLTTSYENTTNALAGTDGLIAVAKEEVTQIETTQQSVKNLETAYGNLESSINTVTTSYYRLIEAKQKADTTGATDSSEDTKTPTTVSIPGMIKVDKVERPGVGGWQEEPTTPQVYSLSTSQYAAKGFDSIVAGDFDNDVVFTIKYKDASGKEQSFESNQSAIFDKSTTTEYYHSHIQTNGFEGYASDAEGKKTSTKLGTIYDKNSEIFQQLNLGVTGKADVYPAAGTIAVMNDIPYYFQYDKKGNPRWAVIWDESTEEGGNLGTYQKGLVDAIKAASMSTGGYTGEWGSEGKFLLAHEKELVLNKTDTRNILDAVDIVRSLNTSMLKTTSGLGSGYDLSMAAWELAKDFVIEQTVHINAEFPNATNSSEIQEAFEELILLATQHAFEDVKGR